MPNLLRLCSNIEGLLWYSWLPQDRIWVLTLTVEVDDHLKLLKSEIKRVICSYLMTKTEGHKLKVTNSTVDLKKIVHIKP